MATKTKHVPASAVREWFNETKPEGVPAPGARGKIATATIAAFNKANKGVKYEPKVAEGRTLTVEYTTQDKRGRNRKATKTLTTEAARVLLGQPTSKRGRFSMKALSEALAKADADAKASVSDA